MTSTPSATAWSMAAARSDAKPLAVEPFFRPERLYAAMRARGAMPLIGPNPAASPVGWMPKIPPAVDDVCVPWPL
jgi:hypothetical protein